MGRGTGVLAIVVALAGTAHADGWYFTEGIGGTTLRGPLAHRYEDGFSARWCLGRRIERWSFEGFVALRVLGVQTGTGFGVDLRYATPLAPWADAYLRGGLSRLEMDDDYGGRGLQYGAGIQVGGKVRALGLLFWPLFFTDWGPKIKAAAWLDLSQQVVRLHRPGSPSLDGRLGTWMVGVGFGTDF